MQAATVSANAAAPGRRAGYAVTAGVLVAVMLGGTLPIPGAVAVPGRGRRQRHRVGLVFRGGLSEC
jgi:threonine/homoserine/homoserine lactone efflux protein